jgi:feruloyl esterase
VVSNDSGHQGAGFDATFMEDQEALLSFLYQANATVTVIAKQMVEKYYGKAPHRSYWVGCSTGGREAMMMSQRFRSFRRHRRRRAGHPHEFLEPRAALGRHRDECHCAEGCAGQATTRLALSDSDRKLVVDGMLAACDAIDGSKDGLVFAPQACKFDPQVLVCTGAKNEGCLTVEQVAAVKIIMTGPKTALGRQVYPVTTGTRASSRSAALPGIWWVGDSEANQRHQHGWMPRRPSPRPADGRRHQRLDEPFSFQWRGGKLIFYHGVSDPWFSARRR